MFITLMLGHSGECLAAVELQCEDADDVIVNIMFLPFTLTPVQIQRMHHVFGYIFNCKYIL